MSGRGARTVSPLSPCGRARARLASTVRGKRRPSFARRSGLREGGSRVGNESPLTLSAMRLARILMHYRFLYLSAARARSRLPARSRSSAPAKAGRQALSHRGRGEIREALA